MRVSWVRGGLRSARTPAASDPTTDLADDLNAGDQVGQSLWSLSIAHRGRHCCAECTMSMPCGAQAAAPAAFGSSPRSPKSVRFGRSLPTSGSTMSPRNLGTRPILPSNRSSSGPTPRTQAAAVTG